jgi:hypothetical protein
MVLERTNIWSWVLAGPETKHKCAGEGSRNSMLCYAAGSHETEKYGSGIPRGPKPITTVQAMASSHSLDRQGPRRFSHDFQSRETKYGHESRGTRNECAGEDQQQNYQTRTVEEEWILVVRPISRRRGGPISKHVRVELIQIWSWFPRRDPTSRITVLARPSSKYCTALQQQD